MVGEEDDNQYRCPDCNVDVDFHTLECPECKGKWSVEEIVSREVKKYLSFLEE